MELLSVNLMKNGGQFPSEDLRVALNRMQINFRILEAQINSESLQVNRLPLTSYQGRMYTSDGNIVDRKLLIASLEELGLSIGESISLSATLTTTGTILSTVRLRFLDSIGNLLEDTGTGTPSAEGATITESAIIPAGTNAICAILVWSTNPAASTDFVFRIDDLTIKLL